MEADLLLFVNSMANILLGYWYKLYIDQTPCEQILEKEVAKLGVRYRTQHPFLRQKPAAFADFYFPDHNLIVEVDDPSHEEPKKKKKDRERTKALSALNLTVLRFKNTQIMNNLSDVVAEITRRIKLQSTSSGDPASSSLEQVQLLRQLQAPCPATLEPSAKDTPAPTRRRSSRRKRNT